MKKPVTVTITGAAGQIGYALAFRVASGQMLGADQPINLNLLEIPAAPGRGAGRGDGAERLRIPHAQQGDGDATMRASPSRTATSRCWWARGRAVPGMERKDLLLENAKIFSAQGKALDAAASRDVRVLVVGNPANTNALIAQRNAPSLSPDRFTAMTRLDHNRALSQVSEKTGSRARQDQEGDHLGQSFGDAVSRTCITRRSTASPRSPLVGESWFKQIIHSDRAAARRGHHQGARLLVGGIGRVGGDRSHARLGARHPRWRLGQHGGALRRQLRHSRRASIYSYPVTCKGGRYSIVKGLDISEFSREKMRATHRELCEERDGVKDLDLKDLV